MFTLPDELGGYEQQSPVFYYFHVNNAENNNSKLHFTRSCISIGINGTKKLQTANGVEVFDRGDLIFYTPGNYLSYQNLDNETPFRSLMIFFDNRFLIDLSASFINELTPLPRATLDSHYLSLRGDSYVSAFSESIMCLKEKTEAFTSLLQKIKLLELSQYLRVAFGEFIHHENYAARHLSENQMRKVIENTHNSHLTLEEISFLCNMSLATFKRSFVKIYGTSPGRWMRDRKLAWAKEQIYKFSRLPKEIYLEAGYQDYASFSYAFKQKFGASPRKVSFGA